MGRLSRQEEQWLQDANNLQACTDEQERQHLTYMLQACKERKTMFDSSVRACCLDSQLQEMGLIRRRQAGSTQPVSQSNVACCVARSLFMMHANGFLNAKAYQQMHQKPDGSVLRGSLQMFALPTGNPSACSRTTSPCDVPAFKLIMHTFCVVCLHCCCGLLTVCPVCCPTRPNYIHNNNQTVSSS